MARAGTPEKYFDRCGDSEYLISPGISFGDTSDSVDMVDADVRDASEDVRTVLGAEMLLEGDVGEAVCQTAMASSIRSGRDCQPLPKP